MAAAVMIAALLAPTAMPITPPPVSVSVKDPDQTGVRASAYTGKFYRASQENYRKCVAGREGRHQYWTTGNWNFYEGTYQMTDALFTGAAWMIGRELKTTYKNWDVVRAQLLDTPGHKWGRFWQDMAFYTVLNWRGDGVGASHWAGGRYGCKI
jgi:hypothetical protein